MVRFRGLVPFPPLYNIPVRLLPQSLELPHPVKLSQHKPIVKQSKWSAILRFFFHSNSLLKTLRSQS